MKTKENKAQGIIEKILKEATLKERLVIHNEMQLQSFLVDIGFIPDGYWTDEKEKKFGKLFRNEAKKMTKHQLSIIKEWMKDGAKIK